MQVGVFLENTPVSPLSRWESEPTSGVFKTGVRRGIASRCISRKHSGQSPLPVREGADLWRFQNRSSTRYCKSVYFSKTLRSVPSPGGRGRRSLAFSKPEFDAVSQVGVLLENTPVSPLSRCEREPISGVFKTGVRRGIASRCISRKHSGQSPLPMREGANLWRFQNRSSTRYCKSVYLSKTLRSVLSPGRRGRRSLAFSKPEFDAVLQVGVFLENTPVSPLSLRERVRVRGF